jgi:predicted ArsR family transcriptional regulator
LERAADGKDVESRTEEDLMEYAGAVDVEPPYGVDGRPPPLWTLSRDGSELRPHPEAGLDVVVHALRDLVKEERGRRRFEGVVAAYDDTTGELVAVTARAGRVTRRTIRSGRLLSRSNVIDLATHRRTISRQIS